MLKAERKLTEMDCAAQELDDHALLERLRHGDSDAAHVFYDRYSARIHRFIAHALGPGNDADADDILQDTFMALAEAIPFFRGQSSLFTYACAIAHRKTMSFFRTRARRGQLIRSHLEFVEQRQDSAPPYDDMANALASLSTEHREALVLKYVEDMTVAEIAKVLSVSEHAVESRLARARKALSKAFQ